MTHAEWLASDDPQAMLTFLRGSGRLTERKARLFAVTCCTEVRYALMDKRSRKTVRKAVKMAELFADGSVTAEQMADVREAARLVAAERAYHGRWVGGPSDEELAYATTLERAGQAATEAADLAARVLDPVQPRDPSLRARERSLCEWLRDIFGDPFLPPHSVAPSVLAWNGGVVVQLAEAIYEQKRFQDLPVLADAFEEAGSIDAGLLAHFRGGGVHAKGCEWLDAVLGLREAGGLTLALVLFGSQPSLDEHRGVGYARPGASLVPMLNGP
jgi:hypothetical protein